MSTTWKHNRQEQFLKDFDFYYPYLFLSPAQAQDRKYCEIKKIWKNTLKIHVKKSRNWDFLEHKKMSKEKKRKKKRL